MENITVPPPEAIQERIAACEYELRSLRKLLRLSRAAQNAEEARRRGPLTLPQEATTHA